MNLSGSPIIQGNTFDGAENNLFIRSGGAVNIVDSLCGIVRGEIGQRIAPN